MDKFQIKKLNDASRNVNMLDIEVRRTRRKVERAETVGVVALVVAVMAGITGVVLTARK
jgi:hypothetical protein